MKKNILLLLCLFVCNFFLAQGFDISTTRIGPYKISMENNEADKLGPKLKLTRGELKNAINYNGEIILAGTDPVFDNHGNETSKFVIQRLITKSKKFKTKSGIGIGSTKDELINAYKSYSNYSVYPAYDDNGKTLKNTSNFVLNDIDAGTCLNFILTNDVITEIQIYLNEGC